MAGENVQYTFALNSNGEPNRINYDGGEARCVVRLNIKQKDTLRKIHRYIYMIDVVLFTMQPSLRDG